MVSVAVVLGLFFVCLLYGTVRACTTEMDCTACHECIRGVCVPVEEGTDPVDECPVLCDVKLVCGKKQVCVYKNAPTCNCNWISGLCMNNAVDSTSTIAASLSSPTVTTQFTINEKVDDLQRLGYSDSDIRMLIELFQSEMDYHHNQIALQPHASTLKEFTMPTTTKHEYEEYVRILYIVQEIIPFVTLWVLVCAFVYFRRSMTVPIKKTT